VIYFVDINSKSKRLKNLLLHLERITESLGADYLSRGRRIAVADAEQQMAATFVGKRNAVLK
jgi:hypothetical protein